MVDEALHIFNISQPVMESFSQRNPHPPRLQQLQ